MKKLSIEEEAKAYREAIERAKNIKTGKCETTFIFTEGLFNYLFPELEESNGEEVRKAMIDFFKHEREEGVVVSHYGVNIERMIAWLEKQKVLTTEEDLQGKEDVLWCIKQAKKYAKDENEMGTCWFAEKWLEKQGEPTDINPSEFDLHLNKLLKQFETLPKEELASSLSFYLNVVQNDGTYREEKQGEQKPQRMISAEAKEAMYGKPAWSEEDEYIIERLSYLLDNEQENYPQLSCDFQEIQEFKDWLKSLKQRIKL